jgi:copper chaperone CopZ
MFSTLALRRWAAILVILALSGCVGQKAAPPTAADKEETRMKQYVFAVEGTTCDGCVSAVKTAVASVPGVEQVGVSLARTSHLASHALPRDLRQALEKQGFGRSTCQSDGGTRWVTRQRAICGSVLTAG